LSASRLAAMLSQACYELYGEKPGDDTTVAVVRVISRRTVNIFTGPPTNKEDDERVIRDFMKQEGKKVVCGGTSANIVSRVLKKEIVTSLNYADPSVPPTATIDGMDLVTEGVLTIGKALSLLKRYENDDFDEAFFDELDADNGAAKLARLIIEECTDLNLFVGKAMNTAHQNSNLPFDLSVRMNLVDQLKDCAEHMGKKVRVKYY
ncbi:MAG: serine/threonine-protein phosphatase, partial [Lachnoclostridium sp.]|nr:serine/threonine-protein phosphatase [Lachnoclostridium sp.]